MKQPFEKQQNALFVAMNLVSGGILCTIGGTPILRRGGDAEMTLRVNVNILQKVPGAVGGDMYQQLHQIVTQKNQ